ncbi:MULTISPECIES: ABC transporter substrate-binding protein [Saccharothrix]|uniref:ABC transporter substrate-binding protein n=1 Tax=Saccharothrix TaxID=2071 RepID=UPI00093A05D0|nr:ABC transporter substrate-binding protein [Saccharothrix sp. CB00851]OKI35449.1 ABC transporter substrate-binding protein [Saccharothrix sp. CB00851]
MSTVRQALRGSPDTAVGVTPRRGGTLTMVGAGDVDHLDPALAYHTVTRGILRAYTRQLVGYAASRDRAEAGKLVADLATEVPTAANGRLTGGGTRYAFTLREGVRWHAPSGARPVTAWDVVRGIKRLAHPMANSPGLAYYLNAIEGMAEFRDVLAASPRTVEAVADRLEHTEISGVVALDDTEVRFTTRYPMSDFLNMLALPFASPAPREYLHFAPGCPELDQAIISNGPYLLTEYRPGERIELRRNPAWDPGTDNLRAAHVDGIVIRQGLDEREAHDLVARGAADMLWDVQPLTEELPALLATDDPRLEVCPAGLLSPYIVVNFASTAEDGATGKQAVRTALQYAVDKAAVSQVWGGPRLNDIADQVLPPLCKAHRENHPYATDGGRGDPERARRLLAEAGYPDGLTLRLVYRDRDIHPATAEVVRTALARAGIRVRLVPASINELFSEFLSSSSARSRDWELALTGWEPDWYGNNARTYLQPLFDSRDVPEDGDWGSNFGRYRSERVNRLLTEALTCADEERAGGLFREVEAEVLGDGAIVPILFAHQYWWHSTRVRDWLPYPVLNGDLTNLWLADADESTSG